MADRLPLSTFVEHVSREWASAVERFEAAHPGWEIGAGEITALAAFRLQDGKPVLDLIEPAASMSELRIPLRRSLDHDHRSPGRD